MAENAGRVSTSVAGWTLPAEDENAENDDPEAEEGKKKKSGFFGRVIGVFKARRRRPRSLNGSRRRPPHCSAVLPLGLLPARYQLSGRT